MKGNQKVTLLGIGAFTPLIGLVAVLLSIPAIPTICNGLFFATWIYMLVDIVQQKRWDSSKKVGWFIGMFLFGFIAAIIYWWIEIRGGQKWATLAKTY